MFVVMGGTGHVGSAVARTLLAAGHETTVVVHAPSEKSDALKSLGASIAIADAHDVNALRDIFRRGKRLFMLNPPASPSTDIEVEERTTIDSMTAALEGSKLEAVVAQSTYGARGEERIGDLGTLFRMEQQLRAQSIPFIICRAAYYMSNLDEPIKAARTTGKLSSLFPIDLILPMVAPHDAGSIAAHLLLNFEQPGSLFYVEGPARYSLRDVANALLSARPELEFVTESTPPQDWMSALMTMGFSKPAAESFARMTQLTIDHNYENAKIAAPIRGTTTLQQYVDRPS